MGERYLSFTKISLSELIQHNLCVFRHHYKAAKPRRSGALLVA